MAGILLVEIHCGQLKEVSKASKDLDKAYR